MKKLSVISLILLSFLFINSNGQTTKTTSSQTKSSKPEIDRLAEKYKNIPEVTLYTSHGELYGNVVIENNPDEKPQSVSISGTSANKDAIEEFLNGLIAQKKKQGYKLSNENTSDGTIIIGNDNIHLYKKGNMYFILKGGCCKNVYVDITNDDVLFQATHPGEKKYGYKYFYYFEIETGDNSRKGGKKATKFDF